MTTTAKSAPRKSAPPPAPAFDRPAGLDDDFDQQIAYRTNAVEHNALKRAAGESGLPLQSWMRRVLRRAARVGASRRV